MTQVSRIPLQKEIEKRIYDLFLESITALHREKEVHDFLDDLLSPIERLMLAKRLSIAFLLHKGYAHRDISQLLKTSLGTVNRISMNLQIKGNGYRKIIEVIISKEKKEAFWGKVDDMLANIMIPATEGNWSEMRRRQWVAKISRTKAF